MNFFDLKARKAAAAASGAAAKKSDQSGDTASSQPWVEKYRPRTLSDVTAQDHTVNILQRTLQASNLPHMLFYGPPGTGKTSTILALAKELYGPDFFRARVLELNASDERGISIVREKVKDFARMQLANPPAGYRDRYPCPPFKIIILDEADSMTNDAQSALRRTMETYSRITRFCLVCNYVTRIIDPLASRCSKFRFKSLDTGSARARLEDIAAREGVPLADGAVDALIRCSDGDLRKGITYLQSAARLVGVGALKPRPRLEGETETETERGAEGDGGRDGDGDRGGERGGDGGHENRGRDRDQDRDRDRERGRQEEEVEDDDVMDEDPKPVTVRIVQDIAGVIPQDAIDRLVAVLRPTRSGAPYQPVAKAVEDMVADGWSASQVVTQLYQAVVFDELIPDRHKNRILMVFSEVDKRLVDGADEHLAILDLALRTSAIMGGK